MHSRGSQGASGSSKLSQEQFKGVLRDFRDYHGTAGISVAFQGVSWRFQEVLGGLRYV